jgi:serine/threonine-protein kinase
MTGVVAPRRAANPGVAMAAAMLAAAVVAGGAVAWVLWPRSTPPPITTRFAMALPEGQNFTRSGRHVLTLSPDGTRLVYVANQQLYSRAMNELTPSVIPGSEASDPSEPVFSPDGEWVAFWSNNELKKIPIDGGTPITLAPATNPFGASWSGDRILLSQGTDANTIVEVPANGGAPRVLLTMDEKSAERAQSPQLVAGGRAVLFTLRERAAAWDQSSIVVQDLSTGQRKTLVKGGTDAHILPTGHLVYVRDATLFAMPFDQTRLEVTGSPVQLEREIQQAAIAASGAAQWVWAANGDVAFVPGEGRSDRILTWVTYDGKIEPTAAPLRPITFNPSGLRIAPDGTRVALAVEADPRSGGSTAFLQSTPRASDVWTWDIRRNTLTRLSVNGEATSPVWSPDSQRICYRGGHEILCQAADGSGAVATVGQIKEAGSVKSFSPDGRRLLWTDNPAKTSDIFMASLDSSTTSRPLLNTQFNENGAAVSPDGRWLAYSSDESGRAEVYVRPFPEVDRSRSTVSTEGGLEPRWSRDGRTLYYINGGGPVQRVLWSAAIHPGPAFNSEQPKVLAKLSTDTSAAYDVAPDGRFLFHMSATNSAVRSQRVPQIVVVRHWFDELRARVPTGR